MIKIIIAIICIIFLIYYLFSYFTSTDAEYIDLYDGLLIDNSKYIDSNISSPDKGKHVFSYSFWLYVTKPPTTNLNIINHSTNNDSSPASIVFSYENHSNLKLSIDNTMHIMLDNYLNQKWNHIFIYYLNGRFEIYVNGTLEKTLETSIQTILIHSLVTSNIIIGNYNNDQPGLQKKNAYLSHFFYDPETVYNQQRISDIYKQQLKSFKNDDSLKFNVDILKNGIPYN